jgi:hypothetical protein
MMLFFTSFAVFADSVVCVAFLVSVVGKLRRPDWFASRSSVWPPPWVLRLVPLVEVLIVLLITIGTPSFLGKCAGIAFLLFSWWYTRQDEEDCNCFGDIRFKSAGDLRLVRGVLFSLLFVSLIIGFATTESDSLLGRIAAMVEAKSIGNEVVAGLMLLVVVQLVYSIAAPTQAGAMIPSGAPETVPLIRRGAQVPSVWVEDIAGQQMALIEVFGKRSGPRYLFFGTAECAPCDDALKKILSADKAGNFLVVIATSSGSHLSGSSPNYASIEAVFCSTSSLIKAFGISRMPTLVRVNEGFIAASDLMTGSNAIDVALSDRA